MKKLVYVISLVTMVVMMSIFCSCGNKDKVNQGKSDTESIAEDSKGADEKEVVAFLNTLYKDMEENTNSFQNHLSSKLNQYMVKSAMEKLLIESDYEEEGDPYFYDTEYFIDGMVSGGQHGDYNAPKSRDISLDEGHWYKIYTEFEHNNPAPTLIKVKVEKFGDKYMITDVQLNK